jgi:hypothetical protein
MEEIKNLHFPEAIKTNARQKKSIKSLHQIKRERKVDYMKA